MKRRSFLRTTAFAAGGVLTTASVLRHSIQTSCQHLPLVAVQQPPAWTFEPVVGDGIWIWREPPKKERGYLEPRSYEVSIGIEIKGSDGQSEALATTPVPVSFPEQEIEDMTLEMSGCEAVLRELTPEASQLMVHAPSLVAGQVATAVARFKIKLFKQYHAFEKDQFPATQAVSKEIRSIALGDSPGIQTNVASVRRLAMEIAKGHDHPWDKALAFVDWIQNNIKPQLGSYTSVVTAIQRKVGDCEEMSALFVAFCRASGIPARLVWVPNHNWTEFYLTDHEQKGHWIPVHPACYHWFGWTGAHELVLQKGDRISIPEQSNPSRLLMDWMRCSGRAKAKYIATLKPLPPSSSSDAGPGERTKDSKTGEWKLTGTHEFDRYARR